MRALVVAERSYMLEATIRALYDDGHSVGKIWCQYKPRRMFRKSMLRFITNLPRCPATLIHKHAIPVRQIEQSQMRNLDAICDEDGPFDILISAGTHIIFRKAFLDRFDGNAFNMHPALLPRYGGPRPRFSMIFDGTLDQFSGLSLHKLIPKIDAGAIIAQRHIPRSPYRNVMAWDLAIADGAYAMLRNELKAHLGGALEAIPQDPALASYHSLSAEETFITSRLTFEKLASFMKQAYGIYGFTFAKVPVDKNATRDIAVCGIPARLGACTRQPARITHGSVEMDFADARVRLSRETKWVRALKRIDRYRTILLGK